MIMAVTAIWDIKGRVDKVISYATNPQKTDASAMQYCGTNNIYYELLKDSIESTEKEEKKPDA